MGRTIGGFFVGLIGSGLIAWILGLILAFVMGPESIIDLETKEPLQLWLIVGIIIGGAGAFFGGYFARAIGKSMIAPLCLIVLTLLLGAWSFFSDPFELPKQFMDQLESAEMSVSVARQWAGLNGQNEKGILIISTVVSILALAVGGLKLTDFSPKKQEDEPGPDQVE